MGSSPRGGKESEEAEHTSIHSSVLLLAVTQVLIVIIHNFGLGEGQGLPTPESSMDCIVSTGSQRVRRN